MTPSSQPPDLAQAFAQRNVEDRRAATKAVKCGTVVILLCLCIISYLLYQVKVLTEKTGRAVVAATYTGSLPSGYFVHTAPIATAFKVLGGKKADGVVRWTVEADNKDASALQKVSQRCAAGCWVSVTAGDELGKAK